MDQNKHIFEELADSVVKAGGNAREMAFWQAVFDDLTAEEQEKLIANLRREREVL